MPVWSPLRCARLLAAVLVVGAGVASRARGQEEAAPTPPRLLDAPGALEPHPSFPGGAEVVVAVVVGEDGHPREAEVVEGPEGASPAHEALREAARAYVAGLHFEPARRGGAPLAARVPFRVVFPPAPSRAEEPPVVPAAAPDGEAVDAEPVAGPPVEDEADPSPPAAPTAAGEPEEAGAPEGAAGGGFSADARVESPIEGRAGSAVSDLDIEIGMLREVPRQNAQNLLTLAPGLLVTQVQNEGHAASMFLRGFDAEEGEDVEILLQGIPFNDVSNAHGHGYADTLVILPQLVRSVRVVQGPFDPAQGDFAVAGSAEYTLGVEERGLHGQAGLGLYGQRRLSLWWAPVGQSTGTFAGFTYNGGDGWGTNRAYDNLAANVQVETRVDRHVTLRLLGFGGLGSWRQAGVLREDDFEARRIEGCDEDADAQFFCTYDPRQGGFSSRLGGSGELLLRHGPQRASLLLFAMTRSQRVQENFTGFTLETDDPVPQRVGDLADQRYDATTLGLRGTYRHRFEAFDQAQQVEVGVYARQDLARTSLARLRAPQFGGGAGWGFDFDRDLSVTNIAAHLRMDLRLTEWLHLMGGARADGFGFRFTDLDRPMSDREGIRIPEETNDAFGFLVQPRGSVKVRFVDELAWVTSVGLGARSTDGAALSEGEDAPFAEVVAAESGLSLDAGEEGDLHLTGGLSAFYTRVSQDLVFDAARGRNSLTGPSNRVGSTAFARLRAERWLDAQLAVTYTRAHLPTPADGFFDVFAGPRLPFIPEWLVRFDGAITRPFTLGDEPFVGSVALGALYLGPRPLPFGESSEPWFVLDAAARVRWRWLEVGVSAQNLLDLRYRSAELQYVSNFDGPSTPPSLRAARHFAAGAPLQILFTLAVHVPLLEAPQDDAAEEGDGRNRDPQPTYGDPTS